MKRIQDLIPELFPDDMHCIAAERERHPEQILLSSD